MSIIETEAELNLRRAGIRVVSGEEASQAALRLRQLQLSGESSTPEYAEAYRSRPHGLFIAVYGMFVGEVCSISIDARLIRHETLPHITDSFMIVPYVSYQKFGAGSPRDITRLTRDAITEIASNIANEILKARQGQ